MIDKEAIFDELTEMIMKSRKSRHDCVKEIARKYGYDYHQGFGFFGNSLKSFRGEVEKIER